MCWLCHTAAWHTMLMCCRLSIAASRTFAVQQTLLNTDVWYNVPNILRPKLAAAAAAAIANFTTMRSPGTRVTLLIVQGPGKLGDAGYPVANPTGWVRKWGLNKQGRYVILQPLVHARLRCSQSCNAYTPGHLYTIRTLLQPGYRLSPLAFVVVTISEPS